MGNKMMNISLGGFFAAFAVTTSAVVFALAAGLT